MKVTGAAVEADGVAGCTLGCWDLADSDLGGAPLGEVGSPVPRASAVPCVKPFGRAGRGGFFVITELVEGNLSCNYQSNRSRHFLSPGLLSLLKVNYCNN